MKNKIEKKNAAKIKMIDLYCRHLETGKSEYSFIPLNFRDVEEYAMQIDVEEGNTIQVDKIRKALRSSFSYWEEILFSMLKDERKKYIFPIWTFYIKGRYRFGLTEYKTKKDNQQVVDVDLCLESKEIKEINYD